MKRLIKIGFGWIGAFLLLCLGGCQSPYKDLVEVTVYDQNQTIESKVTIEEGDDNSQFISIALTNHGDKTSYIDSLKIVVKAYGAGLEALELVYGGTCMGRTPIHRTSITDKSASSGTFLMAKNTDESYTHLGVLTWNIFLPYLSFDEETGFVIRVDGERKPLEPGETISFEKLVHSKGSSWQDLMFNHATNIAKEHNIKEKEQPHYKGWATWDYYGRNFTKEDVINNIDQLKKDGFDANLIQIDGGWWTQRGDYLSVRPDLGGGMKAIADYIKANGFAAGIHIDGFRADKASMVYKENPHWFLTDQDGETICQEVHHANDFLQFIYFDYSNPEVREYITSVLETMRKEWGYAYFKIDFMRHGLLETLMEIHGPNGRGNFKVVTEVHSFDPSMTSVERTRAGLKAMREGIGEDFFLGCSSIFGPTLGIVDGLRTGADIHPEFGAFKQRTLQNAGNFYLNGIVVLNDADYLVVRNKHDEREEEAWIGHKFGFDTSLNESKMWSDYVALQGGPQLSSDNLMILREKRKDLVREAFSFKTASRFLPLDLWNHAADRNDAFHVMLAKNEDGVFLSLFNWDDDEKTIELSGFGNVEILDPEGTNAFIFSESKLSIALDSRSSKILEIKNGDFDVLRNSITF